MSARPYPVHRGTGGSHPGPGVDLDRHRRAAQPVALEAAGTVIAAADAVRASVIFLALAAVGLTTMVIVCALTGRTMIYQVLMAWDANNYLAIAWQGYPHHLTYRPDGTPQYSLLAFFPLLPFLVRQVNSAGIPLPWAGVMVSVLASAAAAAAVYRLIPQISASQGQVLPTLPPDFEERKVDAGTSTTHECGDEKEFSQKAIISRLQPSPLGPSDDGGNPEILKTFPCIFLTSSCESIIFFLPEKSCLRCLVG